VSGGDALVIVVDCSTTAAKAVIYDEAGQAVAQAARTLSTLQPRPAWHEQDAEQWWTATQGAIAEAVEALVDPGSVRCASRTTESRSCASTAAGGRYARRSYGSTAAPTKRSQNSARHAFTSCPASRRTPPPPSTSSPGWPDTSPPSCGTPSTSVTSRRTWFGG
jgi:hypothetical protein